MLVMNRSEVYIQFLEYSPPLDIRTVLPSPFQADRRQASMSAFFPKEQ